MVDRYPNKFKSGNSFNSKRRDRQPGWLKNKTLDISRKFLFPETKKRMGRKPGFKTSEETKEKLRCATIKQLERQRIFCDTKPERMVENWLLFNNILFVKQFPTGKGLSDFWLPEYNAILEIDGEYWHSKPNVMERDNMKNQYWEQNDYMVCRYSDKEIYHDVERCLKWIR